MTISPILSPNERAALSDADRAMLDAHIQQIPAERNAEFVVMMLAIRGIVRHDTSGIHSAVRGVFELQDAADAKAQELVDAAKGLRTAADDLRLGLAAMTTITTGLRAELDGFVSTSTADRADLRERITTVERRQGQQGTYIWWLGAAVAVFLAELVWRYGALIAGTLLSVVALLVVGGVL